MPREERAPPCPTPGTLEAWRYFAFRPDSGAFLAIDRVARWLGALHGETVEFDLAFIGKIPGAHPFQDGDHLFVLPDPRYHAGNCVRGTAFACQDVVVECLLFAVDRFQAGCGRRGRTTAWLCCPTRACLCDAERPASLSSAARVPTEAVQYSRRRISPDHSPTTESRRRPPSRESSNPAWASNPHHAPAPSAV